MIYFVRAGEYMKIGFSIEPWGRMEALQIGNPEPLEMVAICPGDYALESELLSAFKEYHYRGEWFRHSAAIEQYCEVMRSVFPALQQKIEVPLTSVFQLNEDVPDSDFSLVRLARARGELDNVSTCSLHSIGINRFTNIPDSPAARMIQNLSAEGMIQRAGERQPYRWTDLGRKTFPSPTGK